MARRVQKIDTWKLKSWYEIRAPKYYDEKVLGETPADDPNKTINRVVEVLYPELTNDWSRAYIKAKFRIVEVQGKICKTDFDGHELTRDYIIRIVRRRTSRIDDTFVVKTKDGREITLKPIIITRTRCSYRKRKEIRKKVAEELTEKAKTLNYENFILELLSESLLSDIKSKIHKIHPIKNFHIRKSEVHR